MEYLTPGTNYGYVNHLHNFKCFMDRLKLKVLVFAMDSKVHQHITEKMNPDNTPESVAGNISFSSKPFYTTPQYLNSLIPSLSNGI